MDFLELLLQFALGPSDFSVCNVMDEELKEGTSHGVKVLYKFPWGSETLETLWSLGDTLLLKTHQGACTKLQVSANCVCLKCVFIKSIVLTLLLYINPMSPWQLNCSWLVHFLFTHQTDIHICVINTACIFLTRGPTCSWRNGDAQCCQLSNIADPFSDFFPPKKSAQTLFSLRELPVLSHQ